MREASMMSLKLTPIDILAGRKFKGTHETSELHLANMPNFCYSERAISLLVPKCNVYNFHAQSLVPRNLTPSSSAMECMRHSIWSMCNSEALMYWEVQNKP